MEPIRVLQIVDNLALGGAESVAVNLANDLADEPGYMSFLVSTREEGPLKDRISPKVHYLFLNKRRQLDLKAIWRFHRFLKEHRIRIVHAHSTSFYYPAILKWMHRFKLVWHDHFGLEIRPDGKRWYPYIGFSRFFDHAISVNVPLLESNRRHLHVKADRQTYLPNYSVSLSTQEEHVALNGPDAFRIVCLANIRPQKDHVNLVKAFKTVKDRFPDATLYCLGVLCGDEQEQAVRQAIAEARLDDSVVLTGSVNNPFLYLEHAAVGVLSSRSEGLPLSLIEYGLASLPVVCTRVGQCPDLLEEGKNGILVPAADPDALAGGIITMLNDPQKASGMATGFHSFIRNNYSKQAILQRLTHIYRSLI